MRLAGLLALFWTVGAFAQEPPAPSLSRSQIWDLRLGASITQAPDDFVDFACGANGSPSTPIKGWRESGRCRPDARGLREVFFRYDDEAEYWARANDVADDYAHNPVKVAAVLRAARTNIRHHLKYIGWLTATRDWLGGARLSFADLAAAAELSCVDYLGEVPWDAEKDTKAWYMLVKSRPSFRAILTDRILAIPPAATYADLDF